MRSGADYLRSLRDGRAVYIDGRRVEDVTTDPAFRGAVASIAGLYDLALEEPSLQFLAADGEPANVAYLIPRDAADLARRSAGIRRWSRDTFGLMGRSPDHVASFLAGFAGGAALFDRGEHGFAENVRAFHRRALEEDLYLSYVIVPPQIDRSKPAHQQSDPHLYAGVKEERDGGIVIAGAQMLGTGAAISNWMLLSCIVPLRPGDEDQAISVVLPVASPGVKVLSRRSYASGATSGFDYPLSTRFDETDSLVVFEDVFVPWEHVFVYRDLELVQAQWWETGAHVLGNNQAQLRFATKAQLIVGLAKRIAEMNGVDVLPPVQAALGEMAACAALVEGLLDAAQAKAEVNRFGVALPGTEATFANTPFQAEINTRLLTALRELCGGGLIQLPSSLEDLHSAETAPIIERFIQSPGTPAIERVALMKLAWDIVGSEFAGRQQQYEMFYAGAPFVVKGRMYRNYDFPAASGLVDAALAGSCDTADPLTAP